MAFWQTVEQLNDLVPDLTRFFDDIDRLATRVGLNTSDLKPDHIALRCHQNATAERWAEGFDLCGLCFSESLIKGRPIRLYRLEQPLIFGDWSFHVIELPWPGEKRYPHEGWEHIEFVLPGDAQSLSARALVLFSDEGLAQTGISVKTSAPIAKDDVLPNPTFAVTDGKVTVKFHPSSIEDVVESEQRSATS